MNCGYRVIGIAGRNYRAHRLAWLMVHREWPAGDIDHINGDKLDNRIANLRDVSHAVNLQNQCTKNRSSASRLLGAHRSGTRWSAKIKAGDGRHVWLGRYDTAQQAHLAYLKAKRDLHAGCVS